MTDQITGAGLEERLRRIDPLDPATLPAAVDSEAALSRLLRIVGTGEGDRSRPPLRRRGRPRVLVGGTTAAALLAVALALLLGASTSPPAFAVTHHPDGTVTVKLLKLSGIAGANRRLAALGVHARIVKAAEVATLVAREHPCVAASAHSVQTLSFNPRSIPPRRMLLLTADATGHLGSVPGDMNQTIQLENVHSLRAARSLVAKAKALAAEGRRVHVARAVTVLRSAGKLRTVRGRIPAGVGVVRILCGQAVTWPPKKR